MCEENYIKIVEKEFSDVADNFKAFLGFQERFFESFLQIKLAFLSFIGIIITIVFSNKDDFSLKFLKILVLMLLLAFILISGELWRKFIDTTNGIQKQSRRTILMKIRHIATTKNYNNYLSSAEKILIQEDNIENKMLHEKPIDEILDGYKGDMFGKFMFVVWLIILMSVPLLFLLEVFEVLKK